MQPLSPGDSATRIATLVRLVDLRASTGRGRVTARVATRLPGPRTALADEFLTAVGTAAGRRAAIDAATDRFLAELGARAPYTGRTGPPASEPAPPEHVPEPPQAARRPSEADRLEAWSARACLLPLVPLAAGLRSILDPGWVAVALGSAPGLLALACAGALALVGSVLVWRVTRAPGRVGVVTLPAFLACLLPAVGLVLAAGS